MTAKIPMYLKNGLSELNYKTIILDALFLFFLMFIGTMIFVISYFSIDHLVFNDLHKTKILENANLDHVNKTAKTLLEIGWNLFIFVTIYRSGRSNPNHRLQHMTCVALVIWIFPTLDIFSDNSDYIWHVYNSSVFVISVAIAHYIYKRRKSVEAQKEEE